MLELLQFKILKCDGSGFNLIRKELLYTTCSNFQSAIFSSYFPIFFTYCTEPVIYQHENNNLYFKKHLI